MVFTHMICWPRSSAVVLVVWIHADYVLSGGRMACKTSLEGCDAHTVCPPTRIRDAGMLLPGAFTAPVHLGACRRARASSLK